MGEWGNGDGNGEGNGGANGKMADRESRRLARRSATERRGRYPITPSPRRHIQDPCGFTLFELTIVLSIIVILATVALAQYKNSVTFSKEAVLHADLFRMRDAIDQYYADKGQHPASLGLCALLDKPARRVMPITVDYRGFEIPDKFVVGYGLDFAERYRNLPFIGVLKPEVYAGLV